MQQKGMESPCRYIDCWEVVDSDLGVVSSTLDGLPQWVKDQFLQDTPHDDIRYLTFFYVPNVDFVVLNKEHHDAEIYELLVTNYLASNDKFREKLKSCIEPDNRGTLFELLDYIIEKRNENGKRTEKRNTGNPHRISG